MTEQSKVKLTISLSNSDLDEEELDKDTRNLLQEIKEIDGVEHASLVKAEQAPEGAKSLEAAAVLGAWDVVVKVASIPGFFGFVGDRFRDKPIEMEVEAPDGRKLKLKANKQEELLLAIQAAQQFVTAK